MEIICGINSVLEALKANKRRVFSLYVVEGRQNPSIVKIIDIAKGHGIAVKPLSKGKMLELTRVETNQGVAAEVEQFRYVSLEELIDISKKTGEHSFIVILDQINDPHNLGAIIRTAHLVGAHGIVIPKDNAAQVGPASTKAASGAVEHIPIAKVVNLNNAIKILKNNNIWIVGADGSSGKNIYGYDFTTPTALVLGGEGRGLRRLVKEHCDELLSIPMKGMIDSFNVSVAAAIFMAEIMRQRYSKNCATNL